MRNYSNIAVDTTLTAGIGAGDASFVVASATGCPAVPFAAVLDPGLVTEEVVQVTLKVGTTFTATRGFDGTTAAAHALGATVRHSAIAGDFTDLQAADTTNAAAIASEATTRGNADTTLAGMISTEATTRGNADTALQTNITNEASARAVADTTLQTNIDAKQPLDATLTALAALVIAADKLIYGTGPDAFALADFTAAARTFVAATDAAGQRSALGLGSLAVLSSITASLISDASANGRSLITAADYAAMRALLSLGTIALLNSIATANIDNDAVTYAKMQNVSANNRILGAVTAGDVIELTGAQVLTITGAQTAVSPGRSIIGGGATLYSLPGVVCTAQGVAALAANQLRYLPIKVETTITLDRIALEVTVVGAGGTTARMGIYNCDVNRQPTSLVLDAGTVATDSLGVKAITINQQLTPGLYLLALNSDGTPTLRYARGMIPTADIGDALGAALFTGNYRKTLAYAAFAGTGVAWDTNGADTAPTQYNVFVRIASIP